MKQIAVLLGLSLTFILNGQIASKKSIIDYYDYIVVIDSSQRDSMYAPLYINKDEIKLMLKSPSEEDGSVHIYVNRIPSIGRFNSGDIILDHREFNDYDNNTELINYLISIWKTGGTNGLLRGFGLTTEKNGFFSKASGDSLMVYPADSVIAASVSCPTGADSTLLYGSVFTLTDGSTSSYFQLLPGDNVDLGFYKLGLGYKVYLDTLKIKHYGTPKGKILIFK